ncbi:MAG: serine/threonine protein kinase [Myxococcales bacterium]|nr:serine/threonine protein kinase [Myxococcales bacterium]MBK7194808.1 serine/threonine protein kinase [Myxococcales bacterium]MBP6847848.1 serine/threonine protein kinase [Kofleriaceae bacterium]
MGTVDSEATITLGPLAMPAPAVALPSPSFAERYRLGAVLAEGGLATVRAAHDVVLDRHVAVKQLRDPDPGLTTRFLREARVTSRLIHPNIVPVYDLGLDLDGVPSYAMKWVEGRSLAAAIAAAPTLDERLALVPAVIAIAEAVAYAHTQRVIHRDLKPANVILGSFGEVVVIDWGLALRLDDEDEPRRSDRPSSPDPRLTSAGSVLGTPCYMPPEQARGDRVDTRADIYALGAILYQLVAGTAPYDVSGAHSAASGDPVWAQVVAGPPRPIAVIAADVPLELVAIIERAMARAPADRYADAPALAAALQAFLTHQTSHRVASAANDRVDELVAMLASADAGSADAVTAIHRLADVARFGLEQALAAWPTNPSAVRGLARLRTALFDFEFERDNLGAAAELAAELPDDDPRHAALTRRREVLVDRTAQVMLIERERDLTVGARERTILSATLLVVMAVMFMQTLVAGVSLGEQASPLVLRRNAIIVCGVIAVGAALGRRGLFANHASAAAGRAIIGAAAAVLANRCFAVHIGLGAAPMMTVDLFLITVAFVTYGRFVAAVPLIVAAAVAASWPVTTRLGFNLGVFIAGVVLLLSWRREARRAIDAPARPPTA